MEWLSQNWIWLVLAGGAFWFFSRGGHGGLMGGCGGHHGAHGGSAQDSNSKSVDAGRPAVKEEKAGQPAEQSTSSHRHGRGGCC